MKRFLYFLLFLLIVGGMAAWLVLGSGTAFTEKTKSFIVEEGQTDKASVINLMEKKSIIKHGSVFAALAGAMGSFEKLKPGKYEVKQGESLLNIARMLKNGKQAQSKLIITKLRTKEDLARLISRNFANDSTEVMQFLNSNDSLKPFNVDSNTVFTLLIPDTYTYYWNTSLRKIFQKLHDAKNSFWNKNDRTKKAEDLGFSPNEIYTLASIVEEESNDEGDRPKIASVYMNRLHRNMALQADPTVKFALKDFMLKRIYEKHTQFQSPYNTYRNKGLPPGPICTPSPKCLDAVLNAPRTDYIYFVANANLDGGSHFSSSYTEHLQYAKEYQKALDTYMEQKKQNQAP